MRSSVFSAISSVFFVLILTGSQVMSVSAQHANEPAPLPELEVFVDDWMEATLADHHIAGATISMVKGGETILAKGYGWADIDRNIPVDAEKTLFRIGSVTKLFTWTAVMQLVDEGKLDLDRDVNDYIDFEIPNTYPQAITLRHLLSHSAGFEDNNFGYTARTPAELQSLQEWLPTHIPARVRAPGELSSYSNYGTALAGYIIERVSGMSYADYLEQNIFAPLQMDSTTIQQPLPEHLAVRMSTGYDHVNDNFSTMPFDLIQGAPMGAISSSATDMANFMLAHLGDGIAILSPAKRTQMQSTLFRVEPRFNGFAYGFYEMDQSGQRIIGHGGDLGAFHSLLALLPEQDLGIFISFNTADAAETVLLPEEFLNAFLAAYFPIPRSARSENPTDQKTLEEAFAGSYRMTRSSYTTLEKIFSQLFVTATVQAADDGVLQTISPYGQKRFYEIEPGVFQIEDGNDLLTFHTDGSGSKKYLILSSDPTTAFEKMAWYEAPLLHLPLLLIGVLLMLSEIIAAPIRFLRRKKDLQPKSKAARHARRLLTSAAWLGTLFIPALLFTIDGYAYGDVNLLNLALTLPIIMLVLNTGALFFLIPAWKQNWWRTTGKIHYTLVVFAVFSYAWFLHVWHLLGWRY